MRRFLRNKLSVVALVLTVVTLITGVALAANSTSSSSSPAGQLTSSVVEIVPLETEVEAGGNLRIAGAGFEPGAIVLFQIILGGGLPKVTVQGGFANDAGAFLADADLPDLVTPGLYTIRAIVAGGAHVASAPLIVVEAK